MAIPLADQPPVYPAAGSAQFTRVVVTRELEAALLQEDSGDLRDISYLFDWLGVQDGIAELSRFSKSVPRAVRCDLAVALLSRELQSYQPEVISLLLDSSAPVGNGKTPLALSVGAERTLHLLLCGRFRSNPQQQMSWNHCGRFRKSRCTLSSSD
jgi:hypothetical protein